MTPEPENNFRHWKRSFEPGFDVEADNPSPTTGYTKGQKKWIKRAWMYVTGGWRCQFPVWIGDRGGLCNSEKHIQIHHINPRGYSALVMQEEPDRPDNGIPICGEHHVRGKKWKKRNRRDQDIIHPDTATAFDSYRGKKQGLNPFKIMADKRKEKVKRGETYWIEDNDNYFADRAEIVVNTYVAENTDDVFPKRQRRKRRK